MKRLENQTAVVTGGGAGIGAACVRKLLDEGANVLLIDRDEAALDAAYKQYEREEGATLRIAMLDISRDSDRCTAVDEAIAWRGSCDILVNNAAMCIMKGIEAEESDWREIFNSNVVACANLGHRMATKGRFKGANRAIVNVCSISATHAQPHFATYSASKGALLTLTKCMALDLAGSGIRVNSVSPGTIWTESNAGHIRRKFGVDRVGADAHPELGGKHILRRLGDTFEVANAICFLASGEASFITGTNLNVDGGYSVI